MRDNERQSAIILSVIGIVPVVWLALLIAPSVKGGLPEILPSLMNVFNNPFHIEVCEDSVKTVLIDTFNAETFEPDTLGITFLRRGVIGVSTVI